MRKPVSLARTLKLLLIAVLMAVAAPLRAADLPLAAGSPLAGFQFDDRPLILPVQQNFQMALLTASSEMGRSCTKMEAYGWRMKQNEQQRVDQIFNNTVDRLRGLSYTVETQTPSSVSNDVTMFTADRRDKHFIFMWSAGEIGLVMAMCESTPPLVNRNGTQSYMSPMPSVQNFPAPKDVLASELKTPVRTREEGHFTPVGSWKGSYTCSQGYTGTTLEITSLSGQNFKGVFHFYKTDRNPYVASGSYSVSGQYDRPSHRILVNPGKWISRPKGYYNTIIVGSFDPASRSFSGMFQGVTGCTSIEARYEGKKAHVEKIARTKTSAKKHAKKKKSGVNKTSAPGAPLSGVPAPAISAPAAAQLPAVAPTPPPSPGIALPPDNAAAPAP